MRAGRAGGENEKPRHGVKSVGESGRECEIECKRKEERKKLVVEGGRDGGRVENSWERERELCEGTRLKRTEQSRAKRSYFT